MRAIVGVLIGVTFVLTACGNDTVTVESGAPADELPTVRAGTTRWESFTVDDDERSVTVHFTGGPEGPLTDPCNAAYEADAAESDDQIVITVHWLRPPGPIPEVACDAVGYRRQIQVTLAEQIGDRTIIDGHDRSVREPGDGAVAAPIRDEPDGTPTTVLQTTTTDPSAPRTTVDGEVMPEIQMYADERGITYEEAAAELEAQGSMAEWATSVRLEPWFDGFRLEQTAEGQFGVVALNMSANPPPLPPHLPLRSVVSRMGQREWNALVPTLSNEMDAMGITGLSYDPFGDTLKVSRSADASGDGREDAIVKQVRSLLGPAFVDVPVEFDLGLGTSFESPPTTR